MATNAGIWIDHKQAVVVLTTDEGRETKKIAFAARQPPGTSGGSGSKKKYTPNDFVAEDNRLSVLLRWLFSRYVDCDSVINRILVQAVSKTKGQENRRKHQTSLWYSLGCADWLW